MGKQKSIFDLFKENDGRFDSAPSDQAWSKLEDKLDRHKPAHEPKTVHLYRRALVAASVMALIGVASWLLFQTSLSSSNAELAAASGFQISDIEIANQHPNKSKWQAVNEYRARFASHKIHIPSSNPSKSEIAFIKNPNRFQRINQNPSLEPRAKKVKPIKKKRLQHLQKLPATIAQSEPKEIVTHSQRLPSKKTTVANMKVAKDQETSYTEVDGVGVKHENNTLSDFRWLLGDWEQQSRQSRNIEKWVMDSSHVITGEAYLMQNDDTLFTEEMEIKQVGKDIYFFQSIESPTYKVPFKLVAQTDTQWVFENQNITHPTQIILSNLKQSEYRLEMKNMGQINTELLRQRNSYQSNAIRRSMKKVN